jgi:hypothetical protein
MAIMILLINFGFNAIFLGLCKSMKKSHAVKTLWLFDGKITENHFPKRATIASTTAS